jgi:hypothetical protein
VREHQADDSASAGRSFPKPTVPLVTVAIVIAMGITTLWSVLLHLARNQILAMLAVLALTWLIFMLVQTPPTHRLLDPR